MILVDVLLSKDPQHNLLLFELYLSVSIVFLRVSSRVLFGTFFGHFSWFPMIFFNSKEMKICFDKNLWNPVIPDSAGYFQQSTNKATGTDLSIY